VGWSELFKDIIQPILFFGLFIMSFVSMMIAIRAEKREIERNSQDIIKNAEMIKRNYELLQEAIQGHKKVVKQNEKNNR